MLQELSIRNFAIIDDLSISFEKGLNILTGETGAGKSVIVNAVHLILGGRASADLIRTGEEAAHIEALFHVPEGNEAAKEAFEQGIDLTEGLLIQRIIHQSGRHKIFVNGRMATTQTLARVSEHLASISGQHAHQNLTKSDYHLLVLDQYADTLALRETVSQHYHRLLPLIKELSELKARLNEQAERIALLEFQVREIEQAQPVAGEDETLENERQRLKHAQRLYEAVGGCIEHLYGGEGAVVEQLSAVGKELQAAGRIDASLLPAYEQVESASLELEDAARGLQTYLDNIIFDTDRLEAVSQRIDQLQKLKKKYGGTVDAVIAFGQQAQAQLESVSSLPEHIADTEKELEQCRRRLIELCAELSEKRRGAAVRLAENVERELSSLGMPKTQFQVRFHPIPQDREQNPYLTAGAGAMDATGMDRVEFLMSANVGEALRPVAQIASGGELSRMVLALKTLLATKDAVETVIFDEVDAGIGGGVADMVGEKLNALARYQQVLCITHLPQIARFGKIHFKIEKQVSKGRTTTSIIPLKGDARVQELARMLAGAKTTLKALEHAREMLEQAREA